MEYLCPEQWTPTSLAQTVVAVYVAYRVLRTAIALLRAVVVYKLAPLIREPCLKRYQHRWTVVTGGTDGIGKAYTFELAKRGLRKFFLIGRSAVKLSAVKQELELAFGAKVQTYLFDFFDGDYACLRRDLRDLDVGFVVNSVGVGREHLERFGDNPPADTQLFRVNAVGAAEFLSCVVGPMERHGGGQMVVLSSSQGLRPIPLLAAYSSAKALLCFLSECIDREYPSIRVQCLTPAIVATKMTYYDAGGLFVVTAPTFARQAVDSLGLLTRTSGCFNHELQLLLMHAFPWTLLRHLMMPIYWHQRKRMIGLLGAPKLPVDPVPEGKGVCAMALDRRHA